MIFVLVLLSTILVLSAVGLPPVLVKQPAASEVLFRVYSDDVEERPIFELPCEAEGTPPLKYRWIKDGSPMNLYYLQDKFYLEEGTGSLKFIKPVIDDNGIYTCFAENDQGLAISSPYGVFRTYLDDFKNVTRRVLEVTEGESLKLACNIPNGYPRPNVFWMIQSVDGTLKGIDNQYITTDPTGNLWFSPVKREHMLKDSFYVCSATSYVADEYKLGNSYELKILPPVSKGFSPSKLLYVSPSSKTTVQGKTTELFCIFDGTPTPKIVWTKNMNVIRFNENIFLENYGKSLKIRKTDIYDEGVYYCNVTSENGEIQSSKFHLKVEFPPTFITLPESKNVSLGDSVEFKCQANAKPEAEIQWICNGAPLRPDPRYVINKNGLVIKNIETDDQGSYSCHARNYHGRTYKYVYLNLRKK